jgi:hypothetical protein
MTPRETLALFCAHPLHRRDYLHNPWRAPGHGMVATNGHVMVVLPDDGGELAPEPNKEHLIGVVGRFLAQWPGGPVWYRLADVQLPPSQACPDCNGSGIYHYITCPACRGDGRSNDDSYCTSCNGEGAIPVDSGHPEAQPMECVSCSGSGVEFQRVKVGTGCYSLNYLQILASLPN